MSLIDAKEILTPEESRAFVYNMLHPNAEVIACREAFLADLVVIHNTDGSIETELKGVSLPEHPKEARNRMMDWISVKDRLPEKSGEYLVYGPHVRTAWFAESLRENPQLEYYGAPNLPGFYNGDNEADWVEYGITHWMPLPEPPKEDDDEQTD